MPKQQPSTAAIALGTNLGNREANLREALQHLETLGHVSAVSTFHDTDPVGYLDQPRFLNAAALLETSLPPINLLHALLAIEHSMGRDRSTAPPKGPRIIDLDLLLYNKKVGTGETSVVLNTPTLILPHPAMHERRFVLAPLAEIAPTLQHSTLHLTIADLLSKSA